MWLERFLDSIMPGLVPFMACLLALVVYDIIKIFIQRVWSIVLLAGSLFQGLGMGDYNYRGKLAVGWHRPLLYCEGEVHIAINTGIRKAREGSCYRDRTRHP